MTKLFVDTNILVDLIADRKPYSKFALEIFSKAEEKKVNLYTSSHSIATTHYLLKKYKDDKELREILIDLMDFVQVIAVDADIIKKGLRSKLKDFEDSIQILCASSVENMDGIVTRNIKDFRGSELNVYSPDEIVKKL